MASHVVRQGECFATIARDHGWTCDALYQHAGNAELRKTRPNRHVLHPGDVVELPDTPPKWTAAVTEKRHRYVVQRPLRELRVKLLDAHARPIAGETYELAVGDEVRSGVTDGEGLVLQTFRGRAKGATLTIQGRHIALAFGEINPLKDAPDEGATGGRERLKNLGYDVGEDGTDDADDNGLDGGTRTAVALFQHHAALPVTGDFDDATMAKLVELHGC
jgi:N-acetylmuramoyl-L-alanine amidase